MGRPLWGHPVGHDDPACRRRFPPWRAGEPPTKVGGLRGDILFESKEYPLALPKKDSGGVCVVTSSLSLASSLRIAYPSKAPLVPSRSVHRSSSSRCKHFVGLRRELFLFRHRLTHSAAPPFPTAEVFAAGALFLPPDPSYDQRLKTVCAHAQGPPHPRSSRNVEASGKVGGKQGENSLESNKNLVTGYHRKQDS